MFLHRKNGGFRTKTKFRHFTSIATLCRGCPTVLIRNFHSIVYCLPIHHHMQSLTICCGELFAGAFVPCSCMWQPRPSVVEVIKQTSISSEHICSCALDSLCKHTKDSFIWSEVLAASDKCPPVNLQINNPPLLPLHMSFLHVLSIPQKCIEALQGLLIWKRKRHSLDWSCIFTV